ncbi:hypothetical protein PsYK624_093050 [Phanerochaete sordida]|uniref:Uncharacterized protein n=1 Tax=Phanerochaete sordida TaxID=48140 RepID=A0A9P3LF30_9APHY|nr:hypothetical protein PsYK624_093050 [Phanerochaete sordida]
MKFFAVLAALATAAFAQNITIASPSAGTGVYPGQQITVDVAKANTQSSSKEVVLLISIVHCATEGCADTFDASAGAVGQILYQGAYSPQYHSEAEVYAAPYQNFTVNMPGSLTPGNQIALVATHLSLVGAGQYTSLQNTYVPLNVVGY